MIARRLVIAGVAGVAALALAGCSSATATSTTPGDGGKMTETTTHDVMVTPDVGVAELTVETTDLGEVIADGDGFTLYVFDPDNAGPSTCYESCALSWPPLLTDGAPTVMDGIDASLVGTTTRDDGTTQVTFDGWPLYYYAGDSTPGQANGQGIEDVWWVLDSTGERIA